MIFTERRGYIYIHNFSRKENILLIEMTRIVDSQVFKASIHLIFWEGWGTYCHIVKLEDKSIKEYQENDGEFFSENDKVENAISSLRCVSKEY